jgi:tetratricopeptide (TPR) repeat protein
MTVVFRALVVAGLALAGSPPAIAAPRDPVLDRAKAIRESNPDAAERIVQRVLARSPNDYYALYNLGLVEYSRAAKAPEGPDRLVHYRQSATWLERARAVRVAQNVPDATIFNSLGVVYLATGDLTRAQASFADGIRNQALLTPSSLGKLYANIGYLRALQGQTGAATQAFAAGARLGDTASQTNFQRIQQQMQVRTQAVQPAAATSSKP